MDKSLLISINQCSKLIKQVIKKVDGWAVCDGLADELIDLEISYRSEEASMPIGNDCGADAEGWVYRIYAYGLSDGLVEQGFLEKSDDQDCNTACLEGVVPDARVDSSGAHGNEVSGFVVVRASENMFQGSTGCFEWDAGYFLAEYILNHPEEFQDRMVLELGAGSGAMGAIVSRVTKSKFPIIYTDGDARTLENCRENLQENNALGPNIYLKQFQWESGWAEIAEYVGKCSGDFKTNGIVILGADLLYDPCIIPIIVPLLRDILIHHGGTNCAYLATARRSEETMKKFLNAVGQEEDLLMEDITREAFDCIGSPKGIRFFHIPSLDWARSRESIVLHRLVLKQRISQNIRR